MALPKSLQKLLIGSLRECVVRLGTEDGSIIHLVLLRVSLALAKRDEGALRTTFFRVPGRFSDWLGAKGMDRVSVAATAGGARS